MANPPALPNGKPMPKNLPEFFERCTQGEYCLRLPVACLGFINEVEEILRYELSGTLAKTVLAAFMGDLNHNYSEELCYLARAICHVCERPYLFIFPKSQEKIPHDAALLCVCGGKCEPANYHLVKYTIDPPGSHSKTFLEDVRERWTTPAL